MSKIQQKQHLDCNVLLSNKTQMIHVNW